MATDEHTLLAKAIAGDSEALTTLLETYGPKVRRKLSIASTWQASMDAADVMQVTYIEVFSRIGKLKDRTLDAFEAWITQVAQNNLRDAIRQLGRAKRPNPQRRVQPTGGEDSYVILLDAVGATSHTASRAMMASEAKSFLHKAMQQLPESYRAVVELYDLQGRTGPEVAAAIGRSPGAVHMLRARALARLREIIGSGSKYLGESA